MSTVGENEVKKLLGQDAESINKVILQAWEDYQKDFAPSAFKLRPLGQSIIMHNLMVYYGEKVFGGREDVEVRPNYSSALFAFKRSGDTPIEIIVRFKKMKRARLLTTNANTPRNQKYEEQLVLFPEIMEKVSYVINLNAGYVPDQTWNDVQCFITFPNGRNSILWTISLQGSSKKEVAKAADETKKVVPAAEVQARPIERKKGNERNG
jgi:hypothetical protein